MNSCWNYLKLEIFVYSLMAVIVNVISSMKKAIKADWVKIYSVEVLYEIQCGFYYKDVLISFWKVQIYNIYWILIQTIRL